jgi:cyanate permease
MEKQPETTAAKYQIAAGLGALGSTALTVAPVFPPDTPWWAHLMVWAIPQVIAAMVYIVPNREK